MAYYNQLLYEAGGGIISPNQRSKRENGASIMIGIGGTGCDALRKLKREIYNRLEPDDPDSSVPSYKGIAFLAIDSDKSQFQPAKNFKDLDVNTEFFDISNDHIEAVFDNKSILKGRKELEWLSYDDIEIKAASHGAGGIRQVGRFLLIDKATAFEAKLKSTVLNAITGNKGDITVHIISGISGGTGSGCFIDVCYLVRKVLHDLGKDNAMILGYFFLPDVNLSIPEIASDPLVSPYIRRNGYAALKELDYLMNMEAAQDCFEHNYGTFSYRSQRPPVDLCSLVSSTNAAGVLLENGYNYCSSVVVDYILSYLSKVTLPPGVTAGQNDGGMTLRGHIANIANAKTGIHRKHGALYDYNVIGASNTIMPLSDISTYLAARLFEEFRDMYQKTPSEEELDKFVASNHLSYESIENELTKGVYFSIKFPDFRPRDIQEGNAPVVKVCDKWKEVSYGKFKENKKALLEELEKDYRVAENPKSLIGKLYKALYGKSVDEEFGPFYAKRMLYSKENKNFINVIDGYLKRVSEAKEAEARQESLRRDELDAAEVSFKGASPLIPPLLPGSVQNTYKKYLHKLEQWYLHLGKLEELNELENLFRELKKQAVALDQNYFDTLTVVMETLRDTFKQNYKFLSEGAFSDDGKSYTWKVLTIPEVIDNLNESVEKMNCKGELRKFLQMMMDRFKEWMGQDETKISRMITDFMNKEFREQGNKTILDYLQEKYQMTDSNLLADTICNEVLMGQMDGGAAPLFSKHPLFEINQVAKHCVLSIPFNSAEIEAAAKQYKAGRNEYAVRKTGLQDRIFMTGFYSGVPLFAYQALAELEKAYEAGGKNPGIHLYEKGKVNWREYLPSPIPNSFSMENHQMERIEKKNQHLIEIYKEATEKNIIVKNTDTVELCISPEFDVKSFEQSLGSYKENGKVSPAKCDEMLEKIEEKLQYFANLSEQTDVEKLSLLNNGDESYKARVLEDNFLRFPVFGEKAEKELGKIHQLEQLKEKIIKEKEIGGINTGLLTEFFNAVYLGIISVPNRGGSIKYSYLQFGTREEIILQDASMPYGQGILKLYQAWLTFKELKKDDRERIAIEVKRALNDMSDEMYENAKRLQDRHNPDYMAMIREEIGNYGKAEAEDMKMFYDEFMKRLQVFIRMYQ